MRVCERDSEREKRERERESERERERERECAHERENIHSSTTVTASRYTQPRCVLVVNKPALEPYLDLGERDNSCALIPRREHNIKSPSSELFV